MWRLVLAEHITDSLDTILNRWSIDDAADAHDALDYLDAVRAETRKK